MNARRLLQAAALSVCTLLVNPIVVMAQDAPEIENARFQFLGSVNANAVVIRSGPSENDYAVMKIDRGTELQVVGMRFEWLKITPPEGSFCYVAKAFVEKRGDGSVGRVTETLNVRIGSQLNAMKTRVATKLQPGDDVRILGEQDEYFKILPPEGTFLYVNKQFVDPVRPLAAQADPVQQPVQETGGQPDPTMLTQTPSYDPMAVPEPQATAVAPATQPANTSAAETVFDALETEYGQASLQPIDQQPIEKLLEGYEKLLSDKALPESMIRIAEFKASVLKTRKEARDEWLASRKSQEDLKQKQMALQAEREEIEQRVKQSQVQFYNAVGTLRVSSVQNGNETLYRLTDPANGRTVVYIRSNDPAYTNLIGQFIGVRGEPITDQGLNIRVISPTEFQQVNAALVGTSIAAQIVPPSLMPAGTASTLE
jgi:SH3-like domain-containing protein